MAASTELCIRPQQIPQHQDPLAVPLPKLILVARKGTWPDAQSQARWFARAAIFRKAALRLWEMLQSRPLELEAKEACQGDVLAD
ncbi:hypothetical protein [Delftia tsuruhatensis]|uniref:hypothetical protein n=1 Tax=Delftia tsuruhatensis TaxID=180282 RepID=UPI001F3BB4B7|nr:hypothetical protein [Delftia tsuruhatensis]